MIFRPDNTDTVGKSVGKADGASEGVGDAGVDVETGIVGTLVAG
jgi:hypothetical protein